MSKKDILINKPTKCAHCEKNVLDKDFCEICNNYRFLKNK